MDSNVIEIGTNVEHTPMEYVYVTIPAEYVCVYHRILVMLADYGVEMLKDCKASCKDRNSGVIECFNMFNAAVAARKLGGGDVNNKYTKEAETLIKYIKAKINQIYKSKDNSTDFVFPIDENGEIKAFVSCGERPMFYINPDTGDLYEHKFNNGFTEHFILGPEDIGGETNVDYSTDLNVVITPYWDRSNSSIVPCAGVTVVTNEDDPTEVPVTDDEKTFYFDGVPVKKFEDVQVVTPGTHRFEVVINKGGKTYYAVEEKFYDGL